MSADPLQTGQLGRDLVTVELRNRDFVVKEALVDRRPTLFDERAGVRRQVRGSAKRRGTWQTSTAYGAKVATPELWGRMWVFAGVGRPEPVFFVVPEDGMVEDIYAAHQRYLVQSGGTRKHSTSSTHTIRLDRIEEWCDHRDMLETERDTR